MSILRVSRTKRGRQAIAVSVAAATIMALSSCSSGGSPSGQARIGDKLTYGFTTVGPLDPRDSLNGGAGVGTNAAYGSLLEYDTSGKLVPGLAAKWGFVGTDFKHFTMTLKKGLKFADGEPVTAQAAVNSIKYFQGGTGPGASAAKNLTLTATDALTVDVVSPTPNPALPTIFGPNTLAGALIAPAGLKNPSALSTQTYGAGPYTLDKAKTVANSTYVYTKNPNYWDQAHIYYKEFDLRIIPNQNSLVQALQAGQVDYISFNDQASLSTLQSSGVQIVDKYSNFWNGIDILDQGGKLAPALAKPEVRQAMNYAIDRASIAKSIYGSSIAEPTSGVALDNWTGYSSKADSYYKYDPAKAKQLLAEAGYSGGVTIPIVYLANGDATDKMIQAIASQLGQVGIKLDLQPASGAAQEFGAIFGGKAAMTSIPISTFDPYLLWRQMWLKGGSLNPLQNEDPDLTAAFNKAVAAPSASAGPLWQAANEQLVEKAWTLPVVKVKTVYALSKNVAGAAENPVTGVLFVDKLRPAQ